MVYEPAQLRFFQARFEPSDGLRRLEPASRYAAVPAHGVIFASVRPEPLRRLRCRGRLGPQPVPFERPKNRHRRRSVSQ